MIGCRFAIPFTLATTLGLSAVALTGDPDMKALSPADVSAGLPAAAAAAALLGKSGAAALLVLLFLAVTSATSAELIAVSSLLTYDVYKVCSILCADAMAVDAICDTIEIHQSEGDGGADFECGAHDGARTPLIEVVC